jgi:hypothetical protein
MEASQITEAIAIAAHRRNNMAIAASQNPYESPRAGTGRADTVAKPKRTCRVPVYIALSAFFFAFFHALYAFALLDNWMRLMGWMYGLVPMPGTVLGHIIWKSVPITAVVAVVALTAAARRMPWWLWLVILPATVPISSMVLYVLGEDWAAEWMLHVTAPFWNIADAAKGGIPDN